MGEPPPVDNCHDGSCKAGHSHTGSATDSSYRDSTNHRRSLLGENEGVFAMTMGKHEKETHPSKDGGGALPPPQLQSQNNLELQKQKKQNESSAHVPSPMRSNGVEG